MTQYDDVVTKLINEDKAYSARSRMFNDGVENPPDLTDAPATAQAVVAFPSPVSDGKTWEDMGRVEQAWNSVNSGLHSWKKGQAASSAIENTIRSEEGLNVFSDDVLDAVEGDEEAYKGLMTLLTDPGNGANKAFKQKALKSAMDDARRFRELQSLDHLYKTPEAMVRASQAAEGKGLMEGLSAAAGEIFSGDVLGNLIYLTGTSTGAMLPYMVMSAATGGAVGATGRALKAVGDSAKNIGRLANAVRGGAFTVGSYQNEFGQYLLDEMERRGLDPKDIESYRAILGDQYDEFDRSRGARATGVSIFDGVSAAIAPIRLNPAEGIRKLRTLSFLPEEVNGINLAGTAEHQLMAQKRYIKAHEVKKTADITPEPSGFVPGLQSIATQTVVQGALGGAGEYVGTTAAGGEVNAADVLMEMIGEFSSAPLEVFTHSMTSMSDYRKNVVYAKEAKEFDNAAKKTIAAQEAIASAVKDGETLNQWAERVGKDSTVVAFAQDLVDNGQIEGIKKQNPELAAKIEEAAEKKESVVLPVAEVVKIANTDAKLAENIVYDSRVNVDGMTPRQADEFEKTGRKEVEQQFEKIIAKSKLPEGHAKQAREIAGNITKRLVSTGVSEDVARTQALAWQSMLTMVSRRTGMEPAKIFNDVNMSIAKHTGNGVKGGLVAKARTSGEKVPEQQVPAPGGGFNQDQPQTQAEETGIPPQETASPLTPEEQSLLDASDYTEEEKADAIAKISEAKRDNREEDGWVPLIVSAFDRKDNGKPEIKWATVPYSYDRDEEGNTLEKGSVEYMQRVNALARLVHEAVYEVFIRSKTGKDENAVEIINQSSWYRAMRTRLRDEFGSFGDLLADLLGATSPNTPVETNWQYAVDIVRRLSRGDWDEMMPKWEKWDKDREAALKELEDYVNTLLADGKTQKAIKDDEKYKSLLEKYKALRETPAELMPRKENGTLYGFNSGNAVRAILNHWREVRNAKPILGLGSTAPKAITFSGNLIGYKDRATIDVWAARMLNRLAGRARIPSRAETGVTGDLLESGETTQQFGMGQDVFHSAAELIRKDSRMRRNAKLHNIGDDDLQAVAWFIEKEIWAKGGWTSLAGEGGSFESEANFEGNPDRAGLKKARSDLNRKGVSAKRKAAAEEFMKTAESRAGRYQGGLSLQMSMQTQGEVFIPLDADMAAAAQSLKLAAYEADPNGNLVLGFKANSTFGVYGTDRERSFDIEMVVRDGYDPSGLLREIVRKAQERRQDSTFMSRVLKENETVDLTKHRPGVEIYFQESNTLDNIKPLLDKLAKKGVTFYTVITDARRDTATIQGVMPKVVGVRFQFIPEFDERYGGTGPEGKKWSEMTDAEISDAMEAKDDEYKKIAKQCSRIAGVTVAKVYHYDTTVLFRNEYEEVLNENDVYKERTTGASEGEIRGGVPEGPDGSGREGDSGRPADGTEHNRASGGSGQNATRGPAALPVLHGSSGVSVRVGDTVSNGAKRARQYTEQLDSGGFNQSGSGSGRSVEATESRGILTILSGQLATSKHYGKRSSDSATSVLGVHFSTEERPVLDSSYYGAGLKGAEKERLEYAPDIAHRIYFYVPKDGGPITPEAGVGLSVHSINLDNIYDLSADPLGISRKAAEAARKNHPYGMLDEDDWATEKERAVIAAGFDGYVKNSSHGQRVAVLVGEHKVEPEYKGVAILKNPGGFNQSPADALISSGIATPIDGGASMEQKASMQSEMAKDPQDKAYFDAIARGDMETAQQMISEKAASAGYADAIPEQTEGYTVRTTPPPKKTIKAYKVFYVNPQGEPTTLFVGGAAAVPRNVWINANSAYHFQNPQNGLYYVPTMSNPNRSEMSGKRKNKNTGEGIPIPNDEVRAELLKRGFIKKQDAAKVTCVAYRPGWHAGTLPYFPQGGKAVAGSNYGKVHEWNQVVFEVEIDADKDYTPEARSQPKAFTKSGKLDVRRADLQYMPEGGMYYYTTNPMLDPSEDGWVISASMKIVRAVPQEECDAILAKAGKAPQEWEQGKMDLSRLGVTDVNASDAHKKTLAPVTYDVNGNIIALSERFDPNSDSVLRQSSDGFYQIAYHGSPYAFDRFSLDHIGEGEGAQAHGYGIYLAKERQVAMEYKIRLSDNKRKFDFPQALGAGIDNLPGRLYRHTGRAWADVEFLYERLSKTDEELIEEEDLGGEGVVYITPNEDEVDLFYGDFDYRSVMVTPRVLRSFFGNITPEQAKACLEVILDCNNLWKDKKGNFTYGDVVQELQKNGHDSEYQLRFLNNVILRGKTNFTAMDINPRLYVVRCPDDDVLMREDYKVKDQPFEVKRALKKLYEVIAERRREVNPEKIVGWEDRTALIDRQYAGEVPNHININDAHGWEILEDVENEFGGPKAAAEILREYGIMGISYNGRRDGECVVCWSAEALEILDYLEQEKEKASGPRGTFHPRNAINADQSIAGMIEMMQSADKSTFLHESAHAWLDIYTLLALTYADKAERGEQLTEGEQAFLRVLGGFFQWGQREGKLNLGVTDDVSTILAAARKWSQMTINDQRDMHELFAEGFESYIMTGEAPSNDLIVAFNKFRSWLLDVYAKMVNKPKPLSPEVKKLYDLLFVSEQEAADAEARAGLEPMFGDIKDKKFMSEEELAQYKDLAEKANQETQGLISKTVAGIMRAYARIRESTRRKIIGQYKDRVASVEADLMKEPRHIARAILTKGYVPENGQTMSTKLSGQALLDAGYPQTTIDILAKKGFVDQAGVSPQQLAAMCGHQNSDTLIGELLDIDTAKREATSIVAAEVEKETGDTIGVYSRLQADLAAHNKTRSRLLTAEYNAIARKLGKRQMLVGAARKFALEKIGGMKVGDITPYIYERDEKRCAREAEAAFRKGDFETCLNMKRAQILNHEMARAALEVQDAIAKGERRVKRAMKSKTIYAAYQQLFCYLAKRHGLKGRTSVKDIDEATAVKIAKSLEDDGTPVDGITPSDEELPAFLASNTDVDEMTADEVRGFYDSMRQLEKLGRDRLTIIRNGIKEQARENIETLRDELDANADDQKRPVKLDEREPVARRQKAFDILQRFFYSHIKISTWCRIFDGNKDGGPWWSFFIRTANERADWEEEHRAKVAERIKYILLPVFNGKPMFEGDKVKIGGRMMSKGERIAVALNMGNESNLQRLVDGEPGQWTTSTLQDLEKSLTADDWRAVQMIWDLFEEYRPLIAEKEKRIYGVEPEWIEVKEREVQTKDGKRIKLKGGYYPVVYDRKASNKAGMYDRAAQAEQEMKGAFQSATTRRSFVKKRVAEVHDRPLRLNLDALYTGMGDVLHDLAWHEWLINTKRLLDGMDGDGGLRQAIKDRYGDNVAQQFEDWRIAIAAGDRSSMSPEVRSALRWASGNVGLTAMGFSPSSAIMQLTGIGYIVPRCGPVHTLAAVKDVLGSRALWKEITDKSVLMKNRAINSNRMLSQVRNTLEAGKEGFLSRYAYIMLLGVQGLVDRIAWQAGYRKAIAEGATERDAVKIADQTVLDTQSSGRTNDLAKVEREEVLGPLTVFYSWANSALNVTYATVKSEQSIAKRMAVVLWSGMVMPMIDSLLRDCLKVDSDDDDEEEDDWFKKLVLTPAGKAFEYHLGLFVVSREIASAAGSMISGDTIYDYGGPAGMRGLGTAVNVFKEVGRLAGGKEMNRTTWDTLCDLVGTIFGAPANQMKKAGKAVVAIENDDIEWYEAPQAMLFGVSGRVGQ